MTLSLTDLSNNWIKVNKNLVVSTDQIQEAKH